MKNPEAQVSTETLGSNFTDMEEQMARRQISSNGREGQESNAITSPPASGRNDLASPRSLDRIDGGMELVHVPQLAERRYSWEEET